MGKIAKKLRGVADDPGDNPKAGGRDMLALALRAQRLEIWHSGEENTKCCRGQQVA